MSGQPDPADRLYDRRAIPPDDPGWDGSPLWDPAEPFDICPDCESQYEPHATWCPTCPSAGYLAMQDWHAGPEGTPCPICEEPKPHHRPGCAEAHEGEPSYRLIPADFQFGGRYYDKDD